MNLRQTLASLQPALPALEARVLLCHVLEKNASWLLAHPELEFPPEKQSMLNSVVQRFQHGEPLPYILGHWEFYGLDFDVSPDVLIPRPETELLIETALAWAKTRPHPRLPLRCLDIGTGSGIIPVTLAAQLRDSEWTATDISPAALAVARQNAQKHQVDRRIRFIESDLFPVGEPLHYDLVTSNPPYIPSETMLGLEVYGKEPTLALDGGPDGLVVIRRLLAGLTGQMPSGGLVLIEIENRQGPAVTTLAHQHFPAAEIQIHQDLARHDRLLSIRA